MAASKIDTNDGVRKSMTIIDVNNVRSAITSVEDNSSAPTRCIEREYGLDGYIQGGNVEGLEHYLSRLFAVGLGVEGGLSQEDGVLLRGNTELMVKGVMPDLRHVIPFSHSSILD